MYFERECQSIAAETVQCYKPLQVLDTRFDQAADTSSLTDWLPSTLPEHDKLQPTGR